MRVDDTNVYRLSNIIRYSQLGKIKNETVAEHSFFVSWFTIGICQELSVSDEIKCKALEAAVLHDIPEVITNDITHDVKEAFPAIPEMLMKTEYDIIEEHSKFAAKALVFPATLEQQLVKHIVKLADNMSVYQYCMNEEHLGNKAFEELKEASLKRVALANKALHCVYSDYLGGKENAKEQ